MKQWCLEHPFMTFLVVLYIVDILSTLAEKVRA